MNCFRVVKKISPPAAQIKLAGETAPASRFGSLELQTRKGDGKRDFGVVGTVRASQTHQHVCFWDTKNDLNTILKKGGVSC